MYNTIEVIALEIKKAVIKRLQKGDMASKTLEGIKHIKILPQLSVVQALEGSYDIKLGDSESVNTGEGGFFIAPSDIQQTIVHHVNQKSGRMYARWIYIDALINDTTSFDTLYRFPLTTDENTSRRLNECFDILFDNRGLLEDYAACYKVLSVLSQIGTDKKVNFKKPVYFAVELIEKEYSSDLNVSALAKAAGTSQSNLYVLFRKEFGISPIAYLNRFRLSVAAQMLSETDLSISDVGAKTGIDDPLYFSKLFKKTYGVSPRDYRKMQNKK